MKTYISLYIALLTQSIQPVHIDVPAILRQSFVQHTALFSASCLAGYGGYTAYRHWLQQQQPAQEDTLIKHVRITNAGIEGIQDHNQIMHLFYQLYNDANIKGILIELNASNGPPGLCELIHREIQHLKQHKPIVVMVKNVCMGSAYMLASAATTIIAPKSANIGSIGTKMVLSHETPETFKDPHGIRGTLHEEVISAGSYKYFDPESEHADAFRENVQKQCNRLYMLICELIANARDLSVDDHELWADGKDFTGKQALELGLIDAIGSYTDAQETLKQHITDQFGSCSDRFAFC
jgi:signal peptide peptidase SppA